MINETLINIISNARKCNIIPSHLCLQMRTKVIVTTYDEIIIINSMSNVERITNDYGDDNYWSLRFNDNEQIMNLFSLICIYDEEFKEFEGIIFNGNSTIIRNRKYNVITLNLTGLKIIFKCFKKHIHHSSHDLEKRNEFLKLYDLWKTKKIIKHLKLKVFQMEFFTKLDQETSLSYKQKIINGDNNAIKISKKPKGLPIKNVHNL